MGIEVGEFLPAKPFETCNSSAAELYWRPDSVFLCMNSDADIHHRLGRQDRLRLCDVCEQAPATVSCEADSAALCFTCDRDIHSANPLANRHDRRPVSPFFYDTADAGNFRFCYETLDEFIDFTNPNGVFAAQSLNPSVSSSCLNSRVVSDESSISSENGGSGKAATADREARVQRYREKKKNRRFKKMIRYASRKAYAESRPRIKGRFVKQAEDRMIAGNRSPEEFLDLTDAAGGYRVVPSF